MIRTTTQRQCARLNSPRIFIALQGKAFTGAALSDAAYFHIGGDDGNKTGGRDRNRGGGDSADAAEAEFSSSYASNGFLSPTLRGQLDLRLCSAPPLRGAGASTTKARQRRCFSALSDAAYDIDGGLHSGGDSAYSLSLGSRRSDLSGLLNSRQQRQLDLSAGVLLHDNVCSTTLLQQDFEEEERDFQEQRRATHTLALAEDDESFASSVGLPSQEVEVRTSAEHDDSKPLPHTFNDATHPSETRPIVITTSFSPFRVVHVNAAWEGLCGYSRSKSIGKTLGSLLAGPETDRAAATALIIAVMRGEEEAGTVLTNYKGGDFEGGRFRNRLRIGPLVEGEDNGDESGKVTHFVGVLKEIHDGQ